MPFALDSAKLLTKAPEQGEMKIAAFEKNATTGKFNFAVKIEGVNAGTGATAENLAKVFGLGEIDGGADAVIAAVSLWRTPGGLRPLVVLWDGTANAASCA